MKHNRIMIVAIFTLMVIVSLPASALEVSGKLLHLQSTVNETPDSPTGAIMMFQLTSPLDVACKWLFIYRNNPYFASMLLKAEAIQQDVTVWYEAVVYSGMNNRSLCRAHIIELK